MVERTARLGLPLLVAGQGQKDVTHNEALLALDALLAPVVEAAWQEAPPADPAAGQTWLIPPNAAGEWAGREGQLASWTAGGWRYLNLPEGAVLFDRMEGRTMRRSVAGWEADRWTGEVAPAVSPPSGGNVIDVEARDAIGGLIARLRDAGLLGS